MPLSPESVVLLGAGASREAGVPTSGELTTAIVDMIQAERSDHLLASALHFVCGAILAYDSVDGKNPLAGAPDVERVFSAVRLLEERHELEVSPFVSAWHEAVRSLERLQPGPAPAFFDDNLQKAILGSGAHRAETLITQLIDSKLSGRPGDTFSRLASAMLRNLRRAVATRPEDVGHLEALVRQAQDHPLTIVTLNYDLTVEQAAAIGHIPVSTGIQDWVETGRWTWPTRGIRLLKLHGSVDWFFEREQRLGGLARDVVRIRRESPTRDERPAMVFGQRGKLRSEGPFLSLLSEFENQLSGATDLIVIGYSFRDDHVNEIVRRWLNESAERHLLAVDPAWPLSTATRLKTRREPLHFRDELVAGLVPQGTQTFARRLVVWRTPCSDALRRLSTGSSDVSRRDLSLQTAPRITHVDGERWLGHRGISVFLTLSDYTFEWGNTAADVARRAVGNQEDGLSSIEMSVEPMAGGIGLRFAGEMTAAEIAESVRTLVSRTEDAIESRFEETASTRKQLIEAAASFEASLRSVDSDHIVESVAASEVLSREQRSSLWASESPRESTSPVSRLLCRRS